MAKIYTDSDRDVALSFVDAFKGDVKKAAAKSGVPERLLRYWLKGGGIDPLEIALEASGGEHQRPMPPDTLSDINYPFDDFVPAHDVRDWTITRLPRRRAPGFRGNNRYPALPRRMLQLPSSAIKPWSCPAWDAILTKASWVAFLCRIFWSLYPVPLSESDERT